MKLRHGQAVCLMVAITLMWSIAGVVTRQLEHARSFEVTFWRSFFTVLSLLVILPVWQGRAVFKNIAWRSHVLWLSGLCWAVMFTAFMLALTLTTVANVLLTMAVGPLFTALLSWAWTGQRLPARTWGAIAVAGGGIAWMFGTQIWGAADAAGAVAATKAMSNTGANAAIGMLVALCVPAAAAVQWTLTQRGQNKPTAITNESTDANPTVDLVPAVLIGATLSALLTLPLAMPFVATAADVAWLALLGLLQLAIPCVLSVICARSLAGPEVSLLALLEVVFGIALAWGLAGEAPRAAVLVGGALVIGALVLNECLGWREKYER